MVMQIDFRVEEIMHFIGLWTHFSWMLLEVQHPVENHATWYDLGNKWTCIVLSRKSQVLIRSKPDDLVSSWSFGSNLFAPINMCLVFPKLAYVHFMILSQSIFSTSHDPFNISISGHFCLTTSLTVLSIPMCIKIFF